MQGDKQLKLAKSIIIDYFSSTAEDNSYEVKLKQYVRYTELIKRAAYLGNPEAQFYYAQLFETMSFISVENPLYNPKKCIFWYKKSARGGYFEAYNNLASFYEIGEGVEQNLIKSFELYKKGAKLGSITAKKNSKIFKKDIKNGKITFES